jgi:ABC transport system ATP-binding/permease protein
MANFLQIQNLSKSYGTLILFENISFQIDKGQRIALIAPNGTGKTTLFNILCGKDSPDSGKVIFLKDISIGFLEQEPAFNPETSALEHLFKSSTGLIHIIEEYEKALLEPDKSRLQHAIEQMDLNKAWDYETRIKQILGKLNIIELEKKMGELSGGQRKRVALANALINEPELLILDEPTNHLDVDMIEWLEDYFAKSNSTILMVTHDRYFLNRICDEILEIDNKKIYSYSGNYSYYLEKRSERIENEASEVVKARNLMRKELDWIRRQPKARGTKAKFRVEAFETLKEKSSIRRNEKEVNINVKTSRLGSKIVDIKGLNKNFGSIEIIKDLSYSFSKFEKIGIVGNNGSGKTTFLNLLTGKLKADSGTIDVGETISFGYYTQEGLQFDENMRVIDVANSIAEIVTTSDGNKIGVSQFLNNFLFPPEVQYSYVYKLSGGEKRRLYLLTVLMQNPNFLILDEPTNDLDIITLQILEAYLQTFKGCIIIVSHDRYFLDKTVDHIFVMKGDGLIKDFPGNYSEYRNDCLVNEANLKTEEKKISAKQVDQRLSKSISKKKISFNEQREYETLTKEIEDLEQEKRSIEQEISSGSLEHDVLVKKSNRIGEVLQSIDLKTERWMELDEKLNT